MNAELEKLLSLGYSREDLEILDDGQVVIVPNSEFKNTASAVAIATAPQRLELMQARKLELDMAFQNAPAGQLSDPLQIAEYVKLIDEISTTTKLINQNQNK